MNKAQIIRISILFLWGLFTTCSDDEPVPVEEIVATCD